MGSTPIISIVGKSDSGKTSFMEELIPRLKEEGIRVATIKHDVHGFTMDRPGKDTYRHKESGAGMVIISSPKRIGLIRDVEEEYSLDRLQELYGEGFDLILTEGYKREDKPKIEVYRPAKHKERLCTPGLDTVLMTITNQETEEGEAFFDHALLKDVVITIIDFLKRGGRV